ncbi:hypothetical protein [Parasphingorhabdus sp.]
MKRFLVSAVLVSGLLTATNAGAYEPGNQALQLWNDEGIANSPQWVQTWLMVMLASFAVGLLFVWKRVEARWVVGGFITAILLSRLGIPALGIVKLSGLVALVHLIFWSPGLYLLLKNRPFLTERSFYALWSALITVVILFSFIFDVRDAVIYLDYVLGLGLISA